MKWNLKINEFIDKYKLIISGILILIILISGGYLLFTNRNNGNVEIIDPDSNKNGAILKVDVEGAVKNPGVYNLKPEDRIEDAIKAAGGPLPEADLSKVSKGLAAKVTDGEKIIIPYGSSSSVSSNSEQGDKVNINTASLAELDTLPGVGEATAQKIIDYREQNGYFTSIEDIMNVSGIGEVKFEKIKDMITI